MKKVLMMIQESCPYCKEALKIMDQLMAQHPEYKDIEVRIADENKESALADTLDYYYVPTYYVDGEKVHEGVPTLEKVQAVYEEALKGSCLKEGK